MLVGVPGALLYARVDVQIRRGFDNIGAWIMGRNTFRPVLLGRGEALFTGLV
jgi:hypothetical protein